MSIDCLVDFDDEPVICDTQTQKKYSKEYNRQTTYFYKNMREKKYNIFSHDIFTCNIDHVFKFPYMWDPYTGERSTDLDIFGPLYFHPDELIHFFYKQRLHMLWTGEKDENGGLFEGHYGDAVGAGENINIVGRGVYPERYLFRLPIDDCYLPPDSDESIISMGPVLTDDEVKQIEELAIKYHGDNYKYLYRKDRPSLTRIKKYYDTAISENPDITYLKEQHCSDTGIDKDSIFSLKIINEFKNKANRDAVNYLIHL